MKKEILEQMSSIVEKTMTSYKSDFYEHDLKSLENYDGAFIWQIAASHTRLTKLDVTAMVEEMKANEASLYRYAQRVDWGSCCINYKWDGEKIYYYSGKGLVEVSREYAISANQAHINMALDEYVDETGNAIPTDFKVRVRFTDEDTRKYFIEQVRYAHEHDDESLLGCAHIFHNWVKVASKHTVTIYKDMWSERSFYFAESFGNGKNGINGGLIFHGYDEYKTNGSVQLNPTRGWAMHT